VGKAGAFGESRELNNGIKLEAGGRNVLRGGGSKPSFPYCRGKKSLVSWMDFLEEIGGTTPPK